MKVEVVCDPDCPNVPEARAQLLRAFAEAEISPGWIEWNRDSAVAPIYARAFGSPTVLVNGRDVAEQTSPSGNACCRLYPDPSGTLRGAPSVEQIVVALKACLLVSPSPPLSHPTPEGRRALTGTNVTKAGQLCSFTGTNDMNQRSNSGAVWLGAGVLGTVAFAAVVLALQDHYSMRVNSTGEAGRAGSVIAKFSPQENRHPHLENAAATPFPVLALTPRHDVQANAGSWSTEHRKASGQAMELHVPRTRSRASMRPVDVKTRLIALWHQSLARSETSVTRRRSPGKHRQAQESFSALTMRQVAQ